METLSFMHHPQSEAVDFGCDYCDETFLSRNCRIKHTATHFKNKICSTCENILISINGDWYGLHTSAECNKENEKPNEVLSEVKTEMFDFTLEDGASLKSEANDYDSEDSQRGNIFEEAQMKLLDHIEVKSLPEITVPRKLKNISKTTAKTDTSKMVIKSISKQQRKYRKQVSNKATFMDHRPKASCICDICHKTLGTFSSLRNHIINMHCVTQRGERVSCQECGQTFSTPGNLNSHKKIHLKCKAYVCTYCGRGFNQLHNLKEHTNRHTGEKPYLCKFEGCQKAFGRKTNLTAHTRVHTGHKPFKCNIDSCERAYMFEIDLKRHKYSIHGIFTKKHICPICSKVYPENKLLKKHLESHSTGT
ncbi:zinc finger protein 208-like [Contarinia nasturtii]|uniref:zinc finger protein 208-like n=1 Tax=Contarinia nasturtii TaxID=265458 RepID=UPI0012D4B7CB|nr:zinc finger protein 208-like [Contarinia nasturtii]